MVEKDLTMTLINTVEKYQFKGETDDLVDALRTEGFKVDGPNTIRAEGVICPNAYKYKIYDDCEKDRFARKLQVGEIRIHEHTPQVFTVESTSSPRLKTFAQNYIEG